MKHARFLDEQLMSYPSYIKLECINYHKWKVWIKKDPEFVMKHWKSNIKRECYKVENFLTCSKIPKTWVKHLSILNTDTFYKICKKMRKKLGLIEPLEYYKSCVKRRKFKFTSVSFVTLL